MKYFLTKKKLLEPLIFLLIILLTSFLRFWELDKYPPSLFFDEVSNGYNAYSLLKTGKDEYGNFLPLTIRSFGDYNPALSAYLLIPSIAVFGLTDFAVRFPSALLGIITVGSLFFLSLKIFKNKKIAFLSCFLLSISPWHLQFSRYDHEANFMLSFSVIGMTFFLYALTSKKLLIFSALFFSLSLNSYHGAKIWVPVIILTLSFIYRNELWKAKRKLIIPIIIIAISLVPNILNIQRSLIRAQSVGILNSESPKLAVFLEGYLSHFSPNFLFIHGDFIGRHSVSEMGQLYLFEMPLLLLGLISLINFRGPRALGIAHQVYISEQNTSMARKYVFAFAFIRRLLGRGVLRANIKTKNKSQEIRLLLALLLLSPIPAALATPTPHALRAINLIPVFAMISAYGIKIFLDSNYPEIFKRFIYFAIVSIAFYNITTYFHLYYIHEPALKSSDWHYGYKQAINFIESIREDNQVIAFTNYYGHPYIYVLFYTRHDPKSYQLAQNKQKVGGYEFFGENWEKPNNKKAIIARAPWQVTYRPDLKILKNIQGPSGEVFFVITEE